MKNVVTLCCFLLFCLSANGQVIKGKVTDIIGMPLVGASVQWVNSDQGVVTDIDGLFSIMDENVSDRRLVVSYVGFRNEEITVGDLAYWEIQLIEDNTIEGVEINAKGVATRFTDDVNKVEAIGTREIQRAACCSLAGCFNTNASVESATSNIITDAKELRILGLSGVYNQILFDGMPFIKGLSFAYGPGSYPGSLIETIFVSKGTNSVLQGAESISGQINIIPHKVDKAPKWFFNGFVNSFGENQYNVNHMLDKGSWNNFTTVHLTLPAQKRDINDDQFRDVVQTQRMSFFNKWVYNDNDDSKFKAQIGTRFWDEERVGGQLDFEKENRGSNEVYGQTVDLTQIDVYSKMNLELTDDLSLTQLNSAFTQNQQSYFGIKKYDAKQLSLHSDLYADFYFGNEHNIKAGVSFKSNRLKEEIELLEEVDFLHFEDEYNTDYDLPGAYAEFKWNFEPFVFLTGIRTDKYGEFGWKHAPRLMMKASVWDETDIRLTFGKGIRIAHPLSEFINVLSGNRDLTAFTTLRPEEAWTTGFNLLKTFRINEVKLTVSGDYYRTSFSNQIFPHFHHAPRTVQIHNDFNESISTNLHFQNNIQFNERFDIKWSYDYLDVYRTVEGEKRSLPFVPTHRWMVNGSYSTENDQWQIDANCRFTGVKELPTTEGYPDEYRLSDLSENFTILDAQLTKRWTNFEIYSGVENIFDFRQENPIQSAEDPFGPYFDTAYTWGPIKGREFYLGFRYSIR